MQVTAFSEIEKEFIERVHQMVWCNVAALDTRARLRSRLIAAQRGSVAASPAPAGRL